MVNKKSTGGLILISLLLAIALLVIFSGGDTNTVDSIEDEIVDPAKSGDGFEAGANVSETEVGTVKIKTIKVALTSDLEAVRKADIGVFYEYTNTDVPKGFVILNKDDLEGTTFVFNGNEVVILKAGGQYEVKYQSSQIQLSPSWHVVSNLPFASPDGRPIMKNIKYIEFYFNDNDLKDGKYVYLTIF